MIALPHLYSTPEHKGSPVMRKHSQDRRFGGDIPAVLMLMLAMIACLAPPSPCVRAAVGEERSDPLGDSERVKRERAARLEIMRRLAGSLTVKARSDNSYVAAEIINTPLLHYNNPAGETLDATVWAWGRRGRPVALACISQERSDVAVQKWSCEMLSLVDKPVELGAQPGWKWATEKSGVEWTRVADAPAVGETPVIRARQMKDISRRFSATGIYKEGAQAVELRLMDRPLSRYSDPKHGLIDGSFYAYADGTNPEVLLIVECRKDDSGKSAWYRGFARMGAGRLTARLGEKTVWECPEIKRWNPTEPYYSTYGPTDEVFGTNK